MNILMKNDCQRLYKFFVLPLFLIFLLCGVFGGIRDANGPVPFAYAYDDWRFDRAQSNGQGEYLIVLWDHEFREATWSQVDFTAWFLDLIFQ